MGVPGYQLIAPIGAGGFATVHRAVGEGGQVVAIKIAHARPDAVARFEREAEALRAIGPRHAPTVHTVGRLPDGRPYLVMELIEDPSLARLLAERGPLPLGEAIAWFERIAVAVAAAHAAGIVHRDLTPNNLLCGARVRLIDLGLAGRTGGLAGRTHVEEVVGTAEFMAPEQWRPGAPHDQRTDIYALGCVLHLLLTGAPPFTGTRAELQDAHVSRRPDLPSRRTAAAAPVDELVTRCLAKLPGDRIASVPALIAAVRALELTGDAAPAVPPPRPAAEACAMALVLFATDLEPTAVDALAASRGGRVVYGQAGRCVIAVDRSELAVGVADAHALAEELLGRDVTSAALVEIVDVLVRARPTGPPRISAAALVGPDLYPREDDPRGLLVGARAAAVLRAPRRAVPGRTDRWLLDEAAPMETVEVTGLFGRDAELDGLSASFDAVRAGAGPTIATVVSEPGHGKSRLATALAQRLAQRPDAVVLTVRARPPLGGDLDGLLRELLRFALEIGPDHAAGTSEAELQRALEPVAWIAVAVVLGWRAPDAAVVAEQLIAPGALRMIAAQTLAMALRARAMRAPLAIIIDDADQADVASLDALELAALVEAGAPIWVCALAGPDLGVSRPAWGQRAGHQPRWQLAPLDDEAADRLLRAALAPVTDVPALALAHLRDRAGGAPLLLLELVASLRRAGAIRRHGKGSAWYLASDELDRLPASASLADLTARDLATLAPALVAHAELIAVLGDPVEVGELRDVIARLVTTGEAGALTLDARVGAERLAAAGFLVARGPGRFGFRHGLVRDVVVRAIDPRRRARLHAAAADRLIEARVLEDDPGWRARLAAHLTGAGRRAAAAAAFAQLAELAQLRHAYVDAERWCSAALAQLDVGAESRGRLLQQRGVMRTRLGRYDEARADLDAALAEASARGDAAVEILLDLAMTLDWCDEWRASEQTTERAAALAGPCPPPALEARLALARGRSHHRFSRDAAAVPLLIRATELAAGLGADGYETLVVGQVLLGYILPTMGRLDEARAVLDQVIGLCARSGDRWHLAAAHNNRVMLWTALGLRDPLIADLDQVRVIGRELGYVRMEWFAHFNLAEALFWLGEDAAALDHAAAAIALDDRSLGDHARPRSRLLRARILAWRGDVASAHQAQLELAAHQQRMQVEGRADAVLVPGERAQLDAVELAAAGAAAPAWRELAARARQHLAGQELIEILECWARAAARVQDPDQERAAIAEALEVARGVPSLSARRLRDRLQQLA